MALQPDEPILWIDHSLNPYMAKALKSVGYNAVVQEDLPEFQALSRVLDDEHIIPWCSEHNAIWVHADNSARTEHAKQIAAAKIRTVWVYTQPGVKLSMREQLRLLAFALPDILEDFARPDPPWQHYEIRLRGRQIRVSGFIPSTSP
ncbi:MAG: hypothetical protein IT301_00035 [Dehalococcoidia bacterium]|nr:hypothetical protein [Dehalococcoidia bacterium]